MSSELAEGEVHPSHDGRAEATHRQRNSMILVGIAAVLATVASYYGTRDTWELGTSSPTNKNRGVEVLSAVIGDSAGDIELPSGPHRDEFQTSCLICHSARLPLGQPPFARPKWVEIVHKMVAVYGAPMTPSQESQVVDYLLAVRPPRS